MTGFGRDSAQKNDLMVISEIRSVNNRYLEISSRISKSLAGFESRAKEIIRNYLSRGRVFLVLTDLSPKIRMGEVKLDVNITGALHKHLTEIKNRLNLKDNVTLDHILAFAPEIHDESCAEIPGELFEVAEEALESALRKLHNMRRREGEALEQDFNLRIENIEKGVLSAESLTDRNALKRLEKLRERIAGLTGVNDLDPQRLEMEVALLADKYDITEELVRLKSHSSHFRKIMEHGSPCGRRLDFLMQEMNRELNTTASKADIAEMSHLVVEMKEELERMREQAQNVE